MESYEFKKQDKEPKKERLKEEKMEYFGTLNKPKNYQGKKIVVSFYQAGNMHFDGGVKGWLHSKKDFVIHQLIQHIIKNHLDAIIASVVHRAVGKEYTDANPLVEKYYVADSIKKNIGKEVTNRTCLYEGFTNQIEAKWYPGNFLNIVLHGYPDDCVSGYGIGKTDTTINKPLD